MPASLITKFADSSSGIGALGINVRGFVIQLITFAIAFLVLRQFAFKPILKVLKDRRELIESGVDLGEQMQKERTKLDKTVEEELHKARTDADQIITSAQQAAKQVIADAEEAAKLKADKIVSEADSQIKQDTQRARSELQKELVGLISEVTEAVIEEKVDSEKDTQLIEKALNSSRVTG